MDRDVENNPDYKKFIDDKSVILIGEKCDFEDSFPNEVWLNVLNGDYRFDGFEWEEAIMNDLRKEIEINKSEKKFLNLIHGYYKKKYMEINNNVDFPKKFEKIEIGKKLAEASVELAMIPGEISNLFDNVKK